MCLQFPETPEKLTSAEKAIREYIEGHKETVLFMTIGELAQALNMSDATISRFARHMGCTDFKHLKRVVMDQTVSQEGPAGKLANTLLAKEGAFLENWMKRQQYCLERTAALLEEETFSVAVRAVNSADRVFLYAKNASVSMAMLLEFRLRRIGVDVRRIPSGGTEMLEGLAAAGKGDLVILFGFSKVSREGRVILEHAKTAGYRTLLFTGRLHPAAGPRADINLVVFRGEDNEYHSMSARFDSYIELGVSSLGPVSDKDWWPVFYHDLWRHVLHNTRQPQWNFDRNAITVTYATGQPQRFVLS